MVERGEVSRDFAYGMVLVRRMSDDVGVLMVRNWREEWGLPKGHAIDGEESRVAAMRESHEETGLTASRLLDGEIEVEYSFKGSDGGDVNKSVIFYIGEVDDDQLDGWKGKGEDGREILECRWCSLEEAMSLVTFETTREVLAKVVEVI